MTTSIHLRLGLVQMAPVWLDREATLQKMLAYLERGERENCQLLVFGEALLPGYPFWLAHTGGAAFNDAAQKAWYARYATEAVQIERGDLDPLCRAAAARQMSVVVGIVERPSDRGGHSLYCAAVFIDAEGKIRNVHRKLMPTYEERLVWGQGDGHGLRTLPLGAFTLGALNCWENWMPLARAALYGAGENLHIALWPGNCRNTELLTPFLAREGRSYVVSVSGLMQATDIPSGSSWADGFRERAPEIMADGGSCVAGPDGQWLLEPVIGTEGLFPVDLDLAFVLRERQNFDPAGHYSRPDVLHLAVNRERQRANT